MKCDMCKKMVTDSYRYIKLVNKDVFLCGRCQQKLLDYYKEYRRKIKKAGDLK